MLHLEAGTVCQAQKTLEMKMFAGVDAEVSASRYCNRGKGIIFNWKLNFSEPLQKELARRRVTKCSAFLRWAIPWCHHRCSSSY